MTGREGGTERKVGIGLNGKRGCNEKGPTRSQGAAGPRNSQIVIGLRRSRLSDFGLRGLRRKADEDCPVSVRNPVAARWGQVLLDGVEFGKLFEVDPLDQLADDGDRPQRLGSLAAAKHLVDALHLADLLLVPLNRGLGREV